MSFRFNTSVIEDCIVDAGEASTACVQAGSSLQLQQLKGLASPMDASLMVQRWMHECDTKAWRQSVGAYQHVT